MIGEFDMLADYFWEREGKFCLVREDEGFAKYSINGDECYIEDIYVVPEKRKTGIASQMADEIAASAKDHGCKYLVGSVAPEARGSTESMKVLLAYGMRIHSINHEKRLIIMAKEI